MRWFDAYPDRLAWEQAAMAAYPTLEWDRQLSRPEYDDGGGWAGAVPEWPFERTRPPDLDAFLAGSRLTVAMVCLQAHPAVKPRVYPLAPEPDPRARTRNAWHVAGDGSLCLTQRAYDWDGSETAAHLIPKVAGWFLEFLLLARGHVERMTEVGIVTDDSLDHMFTAAYAHDDGRAG